MSTQVFTPKSFLEMAGSQVLVRTSVMLDGRTREISAPLAGVTVYTTLITVEQDEEKVLQRRDMHRKRFTFMGDGCTVRCDHTELVQETPPRLETLAAEWIAEWQRLSDFYARASPFVAAKWVDAHLDGLLPSGHLLCLMAHIVMLQELARETRARESDVLFLRYRAFVQTQLTAAANLLWV